MIPEIRATVDDLSRAKDTTNMEELMRYEEWLRAHVWQRTGGGVLVDHDIESAAQAFEPLVPAYRRRDWEAIKTYAAKVHAALK